jgi:hypothetical protein
VTEVHFVPVRILQPGALAFRRARPLPGVTLEPWQGQIKEASDKLLEGASVPRLKATHVVRISDVEYLNAVRTRIEAEGQLVPNEKLFFVEAIPVAKQIALGLALSAGVGFSFQGSFSAEKPDNSEKGGLALRGYSNWPSQEVFPLMVSALSRGAQQRVTGRNLTRLVLSLDRYFRAGMWWNDRISTSLEFFWHALTSPSTVGSFLSLMAALEAMLSTQKTEIAHMLAERAGVLLRGRKRSAIEIYRLVKDLYGTRSKIVHGSVRPAKGPATHESLWVAPKLSNWFFANSRLPV